MSADASRAASARRARALAAAAGACAALLAAGCEREAPVRLAEPGEIEAAEQRPGDPERGYDILVNGGYVTCGIPYEAYASTRGETEAGGHRLPGRTGRNAELPYDLNATTNDEGVELVVTNCLNCHAAPFDGELVVGLGDAFRDFSVDLLPAVERLGLAVPDGAPARAWRRWADRMLAITPYMITRTVGVNPAPNLTLVLMAHRDPRTLAWHDEPLIEPPPREPLPVKVPPWWRMSKRHSLFHHGAGRGDHAAFMMMKSLLCTDDREEARRIDEAFTHVRAFIASLEPPAWPYAVDPQLAGRGQSVFEAHCAGCHGRYGDTPQYPNRLIAVQEVGTDPAYAEQAVAARRYLEWFNRSFYGQRAEARPGFGYVAPPLDAVWATAPYLHNGSVPSLAALLDSEARPVYWRHRHTPREYDPESLGWRYEALDHGQDGAAGPLEARRIYDTTLYGYGNDGHTYGDDLDEAERRALLEYLKTL